ncbi:Wzz/FepE/Etk N-terminal domain-containing protein [Catenovulum sp. 2E275]|uniref:Wzz/FepE/Etk N-terminal domain-containing protein n=1 Tax=Catenovulum sp. 2E275 TaxID=2980497 RepID=UPI0021D01F71|nr:Wzz/FepE/Etk N-terminal domain-containing protein [Catenovulum sp. 2E275]MCU4677328.1 Wzz/FepE/Etk N-terminal domain-containing protein [Catenovulum sp. 2E275]
MTNNLENRLQHIEEKLDQIALKSKVSNLDSDFAPQNNDDEIDLRELWNVIWAGKFKIIAITAVFAVASVIYALSLPNMYKSQMVLAPAQTDNKGGLGGLAAQYGGLAAMAGINLGGSDSSRIEQAVILVKSWPFLESFINKYNLKPQIMAVEGWNKKTNELVFNTNIYNPETKVWARNVEEGTDEPSSWYTYKRFSGLLSVTNDSSSGLITLAVEHYSPQVAYNWVNLLKNEINNYYQQQDMVDARKNIEYLQAKIAETNVNDMQAVFYSMIESQTKTLMLAEVSKQYLIKTVVPAKIAELKSKPKRGVVCFVITILGFMVAVLFTLFGHFINYKKK